MNTESLSSHHCLAGKNAGSITKLLFEKVPFELEEVCRVGPSLIGAHIECYAY